MCQVQMFDRNTNQNKGITNKFNINIIEFDI